MLLRLVLLRPLLSDLAQTNERVGGLNRVRLKMNGDLDQEAGD